MPTTLSPLRYPGGKTKIYPCVRRIMEYNELLGQTYIEPFAGGAGLAIKLLLNGDVKRIIINDYDPAIYSLWNSILNFTDEFCELILNTEITPVEWIRQRAIYLQHNTANSIELGFSTLFLNRTNISGVIKGGMIGGINQNGNFGIDARFNKQELVKKIKNIADRKDHILLFNLDAKELIQPRFLKQFYRVFINFDPPYVKKGAKLYENSFSIEDHKTLSQIISQCGRKWIVTYDICPLVYNLYNKFRCSFLDITYSVHKTKKAQEYIFFSDNLSLPENTRIINSKEDINTCDINFL